MINFNEPPYMEKSMDYIRKAVEAEKIYGELFGNHDDSFFYSMYSL